MRNGNATLRFVDITYKAENIHINFFQASFECYRNGICIKNIISTCIEQD